MPGLGVDRPAGDLHTRPPPAQATEGGDVAGARRVFGDQPFRVHLLEPRVRRIVVHREPLREFRDGHVEAPAGGEDADVLLGQDPRVALRRRGAVQPQVAVEGGAALHPLDGFVGRVEADVGQGLFRRVGAGAGQAVAKTESDGGGRGGRGRSLHREIPYRTGFVGRGFSRP